MDNIEFGGIAYKVREINIPSIGYVFVSTTALNEVLLNKKNDYVSKLAQSVDELIYFFVSDHELELSEAKLSNLVISQTI